MRFQKSSLIALAATLTLTGASLAQEAPLRVVATTTIVADIAQNVAGDALTIETLLPADTDTHAYEPTIDDANRLAGASLLLTVGAGYEGFIEGLLENVGGDIPVVELNQGVEILAFSGDHSHEGEAAESAETAEEHGGFEVLGVLGEGLTCGEHAHEGEEEHADEGEHADEEHADEEHAGEACDPHTWMNPQNVAVWAQNVADALSAADPANAEAYAANAEAYIAELTALDAELEALTAQLPEDARVLVTNHEFMGYFAARYGFEVAATVLPGGSTGAEVDPQALSELIAFIQAEGVPAIFAEITANPELAQIVAQDAGIQVVSDLYSEALSDASGPASTYIDFMRYNAQVIVDALSR